MNKFLWKIGGEAGFGIMTTGVIFSKLATRSGYHIFDYSEYPSLVRGGHNTYEILVSDEEVFATKNDIDVLVCLNKVTYENYKSRLNVSSYAVYDKDSFEIDGDFIKINVPFKSILQELQGQQIMLNTIALGASTALLDGDIDILYLMIEEEFGRKGMEVVGYNKQFAKRGYDYVKENYKDLVKQVLTKKDDKEKLVLAGNDAFSLGAVIADCRVYVAYPMTPTSNVLTILAAWQNKTGMVVRHAEDEISVINTALGSSFAGVRSSVGTSGGGFALMVEAISFAGIAEIPIVIFLGQRPGPATGMPTWTEQGDLLFACHAGHGEFPKIVLAPGDVYETIELTMKAFDMADVYQTPVIIMADKLLCESHKSHIKDQIVSLIENYVPNEGKSVRETSQSPYLRYKLADDGISERLVPGAQGHFYQANSYEHLEDSHTTESSVERVKQVDKRQKKLTTYLINDFQLPTVYGDIEKSETIFVSWGSNKGAIIEARKILKEKGVETAYVHFTYVYPLNKEKLKELFNKDKRYILIENNSYGQFEKLLVMETGIEIKEKILKYDGRPIWVEEIVEYVNKK